MSRGLRAGDTVARLGGDEFVVLVDGLDETDTAWQVAERLRDAVCRAPVELGRGGAVTVTASFGVAVGTPDDAPEELVQRADAAMYRAKAMGGAQVVVFDSPDVSITALADELAVAVSHGQIRPHVQPVVDLHTGALVGYQGLARWEHPERGLLEARNSSSTSWRTRRSCRSSTSPCSDAPPPRRHARPERSRACARTATCPAG